MAQVQGYKNGRINIILQDQKVMEQPKAESRTAVAKRTNSPLQLVDREFSSFVGLKDLKTSIKEIYASILINEKRKESGLKDSKQVLHMLFKGNPGTGKTTVARKLAKIYHEMNILSKGHFIEAERADLVGEYIGQTAQKTRAIIQRAMGGVLFIDEAYSLSRGGEKDFGKEAIDTLVKHMEDQHQDLVLILAGYPYEMERFLTFNPGLESRFPFILEFDDYGVEELMEIAKRMVDEREYKFSREAEWKLRNHLARKVRACSANFSNARYVRNVIERAIRLHAVRLLSEDNYSSNDLMLLTGEDMLLDIE
ncbi:MULTISPECIES: stage V sporulation protein K [Oceanobacillus]|uniref:stage V sporulation protein K n=3 Tax=Oceanobacillus TaxID=182709 RepID=UPI00034D883A|nr:MULTISPECIES: stage V sporulation protein K [Oceanobacillus]MBT2598607.1 stage V sporulation protein K [Oceanobacillus sp. ISL-74]MBT2651526.1 stage V sporulation protein K [Oceanobacillus sp. ISL-73]MCT1576188.1 stage V sporulation protein K [Oceanobacillus kimchii]MCT2135825.1 stage V sporulation protein K [Oceanobacillus kimchii]OEH54748.1 stage V sporulation protein K [Oceanobacillus sp. E9]